MKKDFGGIGIPNHQDLILCLIGSVIKRYIQGRGFSGRELLTLNTTLGALIFFHVMMCNHPPFGRV
jgi:hypothetical protein